jgi:hypothetical protein
VNYGVARLDGLQQVPNARRTHFDSARGDHDDRACAPAYNTRSK